jgi:peptidoglycan/LPS O-acetylase OafA/YrhL
MYLLNLALIAEVIITNFPPQNPQSAWVLYGIYWIAVIIFSTLLYKYYEKPFMDLRERWKN